MKTGTRIVIVGVVLLALAIGIGIGSFSTPGAPVDGVDRGEVARLEDRVRDLERENAELRKRTAKLERSPPEVVRKSAKDRAPGEPSDPKPGPAPAEGAPAGGPSGAGTGAAPTSAMRVKVVDQDGKRLVGWLRGDVIECVVPCAKLPDCELYMAAAALRQAQRAG